MDVKSRKSAEHKKVDLPKAEAPKKSEGASGEKKVRASAHDDGHEEARVFKKLSGVMEASTAAPSADHESLWPGNGEGRRERKAHGARNEVASDAIWSDDSRSVRGRGRGHGRRDVRSVEKDLEKTQDEIDRAAARLERLWRRGDREFRKAVLAELEKHGNLPKEVKAQITQEMMELRRLERQIARTRDPEKRAALEDQYKKVSEELANVLREHGLELELLQAVERTLGEDGKEGSLSDLLKDYYELQTELQYLQLMSNSHEEAMVQIAEAQRRRAEEVKRNLKVQDVKRQDFTARIHKELADRIPAELVTPTARADV